jgi:hypothetical protein
LIADPSVVGVGDCLFGGQSASQTFQHIGDEEEKNDG